MMFSRRIGWHTAVATSLLLAVGCSPSADESASQASVEASKDGLDIRSANGLVTNVRVSTLNAVEAAGAGVRTASTNDVSLVRDWLASRTSPRGTPMGLDCYEIPNGDGVIETTAVAIQAAMAGGADVPAPAQTLALGGVPLACVPKEGQSNARYAIAQVGAGVPDNFGDNTTSVQLMELNGDGSIIASTFTNEPEDGALTPITEFRMLGEPVSYADLSEKLGSLGVPSEWVGAFQVVFARATSFLQEAGANVNSTANAINTAAQVCGVPIFDRTNLVASSAAWLSGGLAFTAGAATGELVRNFVQNSSLAQDMCSCAPSNFGTQALEFANKWFVSGAGAVAGAVGAAALLGPVQASGQTLASTWQNSGSTCVDILSALAVHARNTALLGLVTDLTIRAAQQAWSDYQGQSVPLICERPADLTPIEIVSY